MSLRCSLPVLAVATLGACASGPGISGPVRAESLADRNIDLVGVVVDLPERQYLGLRSTGVSAEAQILWVSRTDVIARGSEDYLMGPEHLRAAGLPVLDGSVVDLERGMFLRTAYRLGGRLTNLRVNHSNVGADARLTVDWRLFDVESGSVVFEGPTEAFVRGAVIGDRGQRPNVLLDAFEQALGALLALPGFPAGARAPAEGTR